jgi:hypothetical protein
MKKFSVICILTLVLCAIPLISTSHAETMEIPSWVSNTKIKGDFRFRFQNEDNVFSKIDTTNELDRNRWRLRWRFGLESNPNDQWTVGFGLASGSDDPRSTNQTMENFFETPDARLDYVYAKWMPMDQMEVILGKFQNPIWNPKDLMWDSDIMPDGIAGQLSLKASDTVKLFVTPAFFILDEYKDEALDSNGNPTISEPSDDPNMMAIQAGAKLDFNKKVTSTLAATYYQFNNTKNIAFFQGEENDSAWSLDAEAGFEALPVYVAVFGQYVVSDADEDNTGYLVGAKIGDKKIKEFGDWEVKYNYRKLETLAWWDQLPDSDFMGGNSNVKGSEVELNMGLYKNVSAGLDYYIAQQNDGSKDQNLIQVDLNVKFP